MPKKKTFTFERLQQLGDSKYNNKFTYLHFEGEIGSKDEFKGYTECFNTECLDNLQSSLGVILEVKSP